jgi:hypothetical protein
MLRHFFVVALKLGVADGQHSSPTRCHLRPPASFARAQRQATQHPARGSCLSFSHDGLQRQRSALRCQQSNSRRPDARLSAVHLAALAPDAVPSGRGPRRRDAPTLVTPATALVAAQTLAIPTQHLPPIQLFDFCSSVQFSSVQFRSVQLSSAQFSSVQAGKDGPAGQAPAARAGTLVPGSCPRQGLVPAELLPRHQPPWSTSQLHAMQSSSASRPMPTGILDLCSTDIVYRPAAARGGESKSMQYTCMCN